MRSINLLSSIEVKTLITILFAIALSLSVACDSNNNNGSGQEDGGDMPDAPVSQSSACDGLTPTMTGTGGNDVLQGTEADDVILGFAGNDTLIGGGGNDVLCGNEGDDELQGGDGNDVLDGGPDNDLMVGGPGDDVIVEVPGSFDEIDSGQGSDTLDFSNITDAQAVSRGGGAFTSGFGLDFSNIEGLSELRTHVLVSSNSGVLFVPSSGGNGMSSPVPENLIGTPFDDSLIVDPLTVPRFIDGGGGINKLIFDALGQPVAFNNNVFQIPGFGDTQVLNFGDIHAVNFEPIIVDDGDGPPDFIPDPLGGCFPSGDTQGNNGVTFCPSGENSSGTWTIENPPPANDVTVGITYVSNPPDRSNEVYVSVSCLPFAGGEPLLLQGETINQQTPPNGFTLGNLDFDNIGPISTEGCVNIIVRAINESNNPNLFLELDSVALVPKEFFDITPPVIEILSPMDGEMVNLEDLQLEIKASDDSGQQFIPVTIQFPVIEFCSVRTTVSVPDGGTVLLGGIKCLSEGRGELGIPTIPGSGLVDIEVSAEDFSGNSIMLMVTPRIIINEEEEELL